MNTLKRVAKVIAEQLGEEDQDCIKPELKLIEDLMCDSLDLIEIVMCVEDEFAIEISDELFNDVVTVEDAATLVDRVMAGHCDAHA